MTSKLAQLAPAVDVVESIADHWSIEVRTRDVTIRAAARAAVCGAAGCSIAEELLQVEIEAAGRKVLCPPHARGWIQQEVVEA